MKMVVLYETPQDPAAFTAYYEETHLPLVTAIPALATVMIGETF